jgi:hypothetical protein
MIFLFIPLFAFISHAANDTIINENISSSDLANLDSFAVIKIDSIKTEPYDSQNYLIVSVGITIFPKDTGVFLDTYPGHMEFYLIDEWGNYDHFICCVQKEARRMDDRDWLYLNKSGYKSNLSGNLTINNNNLNKLSIRFKGKIRINKKIMNIQIFSNSFILNPFSAPRK